MLERIAETVTRYAMFEPGQRAGVAVSGGADSVCLLHAMVSLAPRWDLHLSVLHLDHQLRGEESRRDAEFVAGLARGLGLPAYVEKAEVDRSGNLEEAARVARHKFFRGFIESGLLDRVALGHTRSDQAETVLFRILRGAGTAGLAGIRPVTREGIVRPLLDVNRAEVQDYLREKGIAWREDSTNFLTAFARNRIRHELLPSLERDWNPELHETLADMASWALGEERYWEAELDRMDKLYLTARPPAVVVRADRLSSLPPAAARRLVRRAFERAKGDLRAVEFRHVEAVLELAASGQGSGRFQAPGLDIFRSFDQIRIAPPGFDTERGFEAALSVPCSVAVPGNGRVRVEAVPAESGYTSRMSDLDRDRISGPLLLRNWRPGDEYRPFRSERAEKLKTLFQQARIPLWERRHWPVITSGGSILWARRFGASREAVATEGSHSLVRIRETDNDES